jgi:quercetin dioxygenase-like cupin family protein
MLTAWTLGASALLAISFVSGLVSPALAAPPTTGLLSEPLPLAPELLVRMTKVTIPPAPTAAPSTSELRGHTHPGSTYVYVLSGSVLSRLGEGPENRFEKGQAWSESPGEAHFIINASGAEPAELLVVFITKGSAEPLTSPIER